MRRRFLPVSGLLVSAVSLLLPVFAAAQPCTIECPLPTETVNDPGRCGAVVEFQVKTTGSCGTVTASTPSGSLFPVGETTVRVTTAAGPACDFKVIVRDEEPPGITVPKEEVTRKANPGDCF